MSKTASGLIQHCKDKLGTPYVYGAKGEVLTQAILDRLAWENPGTYTSTYKAKAAKYIGQHCTDCSGLISWYTGRIRGSYNYQDTAVERIGVDHLDESMVGWALLEAGTHRGIHRGWMVHRGQGHQLRDHQSPEWAVTPLAEGAQTLRHRLRAGSSDIHPGLPAVRRRAALVVSVCRRQLCANGWYWLREATDGTCGWYLFDAEATC